MDRPAGFLLNDSSAVTNMPSHAYVVDPEPYQVAVPQLAIDRQIKEGEVAAMVFELQSDADRPDLLRFERALLADETPLVPGRFRKPTIDGMTVGIVCSLIPSAPATAPLNN